MMKSTQIIVPIVIALFATFSVHAADKATETKAPEAKAAEAKSDEGTAAKSGDAGEGVVTCKAKGGGDERKLEIKKADGKACVLTYTKAGEPKDVATSNNQADYCAGVRDRIQKKLEAAEYTCQ